MIFNRQALLRTLESVAPGLNSKDSMEQSSCFVFDDGEVLTYNSEIFCIASVKNADGEVFSCRGAVPARPLLETLRKSPDEEIRLTAHSDHLSIKGQGRRQKIVLMDQILLDTNEVELPSDFVDLPPVFSEALTLTAGCAAKESDEFALNCVAITPRGLQATDKYSAMRFSVLTGLKQGTLLVRATSAKSITGLGLAKVSYGKEFVWFITYSGARIALRLLGADYPSASLTQIFTEPSEMKIDLPGSVADIIARALPFFGENASGKIIDFQIASNKLTVRASNGAGEFLEEKCIAYDGVPISFRVNPASISNIFKSGSGIEVTPSSLRTKGEGYCLVVSAERI